MFSVVGRLCQTPTQTTAFHRAEPQGCERHRREARRVKVAGASESNALQIFSTRFLLHPQTSVRCCATELATQFSCRVKKRPDKRFDCPTIFYRQPAHAFLRLIMSRAH